MSEEPTQAVEEEALTGATVLEGATKVTDLQNDIVLDVPAGWYAIVPTQGRGSITLASYDMRELENESPERSSHQMLAERAKVDLSAFVPEEGGTAQQWVQQRLAGMTSESLDGLKAQRAPVGDMVAYRLAGRDGVAYKLQQGAETVLEIALPWDGGKVLLASVVPAHTEKLQELLPVLEQLRSMAQEREGVRPEARDGAELVAPLEALPTLVSAFGACSSWTGSDSGSIASNTPITLNLPFYVGTWWRSGGAGSFWGNGYHGNCNNDYYAIDWNQMNSSCGSYVDDTGQRLYAAANGTAYTYYNSSNGYGNYVDIVHSNGIKTRYAHLQSISVSNGASVNTQTLIGYVGSTGNSSSSHLHFGFYQNGYSRCNSSSGYCPNGERASSPQTAKPSPMYTYNGSKTIADFGCYQAPP
ncbi:MAG TPA: M23 family metallopeptidase [Myxococcaceae bacterium]|nr:M23 family metallopeptidase [Myxococcaceae bacterium]